MTTNHFFVLVICLLFIYCCVPFYFEVSLSVPFPVFVIFFLFPSSPSLYITCSLLTFPSLSVHVFAVPCLVFFSLVPVCFLVFSWFCPWLEYCAFGLCLLIRSESLAFDALPHYYLWDLINAPLHWTTLPVESAFRPKVLVLLAQTIRRYALTLREFKVQTVNQDKIYQEHIPTS